MAGVQRHLYLSRLFPCGDIVRLFGVNGDVTHREFAFVFDTSAMRRYQVVPDEKSMASLLGNNDGLRKINVGGIYEKAYPSKATYNNRSNVAQRRELVFDIDITDYDRRSMVGCVCNPTENKYALCDGCWPLMEHAYKLIDHCLREQHGFNHILWMFSGGRGLHCWVFDEDACKLTRQERQSIVTYLTTPRGFANATADWWAQVTAPAVGRFADFAHNLDDRLRNIRMCPILDEHVTVQLNHLLGCPFNVHPCGRLCVPIKSMDEFVLSSVPTLDSVMTDQTLLRPYTDYFTSFVDDLCS